MDAVQSGLPLPAFPLDTKYEKIFEGKPSPDWSWEEAGSQPTGLASSAGMKVQSVARHFALQLPGKA